MEENIDEMMDRYSIAKQKTSDDERLKLAYQAVMQDENGILVLRDLIKKTHVLKSSFTADSKVTAFKEGERNIGLYVIANMSKADKELCDKVFMITE